MAQGAAERTIAAYTDQALQAFDLRGKVALVTGRNGGIGSVIAIFLASSASDFVTGTAIAVDGGYSIAG